MTQTPKTIGVLALQGSFAEHITMLTRLGAKAVPVRSLTDVKKFDGLIIPGGESTTIMQLLDSTELKAWLVQFAKAGKPIYGTCAGMIVLANLGLIDIEVERNAYGPQLYSFEAPLSFPCPLLSSPRRRGSIPGIFIRAPRVKTFKKGVHVLATHGKDPVLLEQKNILVGSFHPELTNDQKIHRYFLSLC